MKANLSGKSALIIGGSRGIGKGIALSLALEGVRVGICARSKETLEETTREIAATADRDVVISIADCTDPKQITRMVHEINEKLGPIDILVNAVGQASAGPFLELSDEDWLQTINLKLMTAVRVIKHVLPGMMDAKWGRIILVGGVLGVQPTSLSMPMGVVNAGLSNFAKALAKQVAAYNVLVNVIAPGRVDTALFQRLVARHSEQFKVSLAESRKNFLSQIPIGRTGTVEEIANVATFLASDLSSYITGQTVTVDGCWTACI